MIIRSIWKCPCINLYLFHNETCLYQENGAQFIKAIISQRSMSNGFIYVVDAHFIDKIEKKISWTQVPVACISNMLQIYIGGIRTRQFISFAPHLLVKNNFESDIVEPTVNYYIQINAFFLKKDPPYSLYNYLSRSCLILVCFLIFGYYYIHVGGAMVVNCHNFETLVFLSVFPYKEKTSGNTKWEFTFR